VEPPRSTMAIQDGSESEIHHGGGSVHVEHVSRSRWAGRHGIAAYPDTCNDGP
jgi:hypothetical protein